MSTRTWTVGRSVLFTGVALAAAILVDQIIGCMSAPAQMRDRRTAAIVAAVEVPATPDDLIVQMSQSAGVLFVGYVVEVRQPWNGVSGSPEAAAEGIVEVDFYVEQAVRSVVPHSRYTLREWGGLWAGEAGRYRVGQRLLVLLHEPDSLGLSSPVHGAEGLIPLRSGGLPPGPDERSSTASQWMVDVRWLQTQTLRNRVSPGVPNRGPIPIRGGRGPRSEIFSPVQPAALQKYNSSLVPALPGPWIDQETPVAQAEPLLHVLALCATPTGSQDASR